MLTKLLLALALLTAITSPLFAAQGVITEVNPSGVHGRVVILQADEGDEVVEVGDTVAFTNPKAFQKSGKPKAGDVVEVDVVKTGNSVRATIATESTHTGSTSTGTTTSD